MRWPILGSRFNTRDYSSFAMIIDDMETILETTLHGLDISPQAYKVFFHSRQECAYVFDDIQGLLGCAGDT